MRLLYRAAVLVGAMTWGSTLSAAEPGTGSGLADNAALQYWQAFAQMPAFDEEQQQLIGEWRTVSLDDPAVVKLLAESHKAILYLHRGARCERCVWGLNYDDGIGMLLPHLARSRDLARLAALHARNEYARGNRGAVPAIATSMMTLARHVGGEPIMICLLVRFVIEDNVIDLVSLCAPEIRIPHDRAVAMFEELHAAPDLQEALAAEKRFFIEWMIRKLHEEEDRQPGAAAKLWQNMLGDEGPEELKQIKSFSQMIECLEGVLPVYSELEKIVGLPKPEFDAEYPKFKKRVTAEKPLARFLVPNVEQLLAKEHRNEARWAMLLAAIAVTESGPEALKNIQDPFGDGPFEYRPIGDGYELQSALEFEGQPVSLAVGRPDGKQ